MNQEELKSSLELTVDLATQAGADCDVLASKGESFSLSSQNNSIDKYSLSGTQIIGVRLIKDQKIGISYSESFDPESLKLMIENALSNAQSNDSNPHEKITSPKSSLILNSSTEGSDIDTQKKIDLALSLESKVKEKGNEVKVVPYNGFSESKFQRCYLNSNGCYREDNNHYYSIYTSAQLEKENKASMHYHSAMAKRFEDIKVDECAEVSYHHAKNWLDAQAIKTGKYDVVFSIDQLSSFFSCFLGVFSAQKAREKQNPLFDKLGQVIAHHELTIKDLPKFDQAFLHYLFDDEGSDTEDLTLLENGLFQNLYHNSSTANYYKTQTTGHAKRSCKSGLSLSSTNLVIDKGNEQAPRNGTYLELHSLAGLHSGASFISGDFSFGARGYLCKNGKRIQPVKDITVAGNFYDALQAIECIGNDIKANSSRSFFAPTIRFSSLSVAGN